tara:strand:- start:2023 stop:2640 length:618 start_codon:yes stop_codon:yes gene_type:complete
MQITKQILDQVMIFLDFTNDENNIKKRDNKKSAYKLKMLKNDNRDLLTQLTLLLYNSKTNNPTTIIESPENLNIQRENCKLLKENTELKIELEEYKGTRRANKQLRETIDELKTEIHNLKLQIKSKNVIASETIETPSVFDECDTTLEITDYDPYNQVYDDIPNKLSDYNSYDIYDAMNYHSMGTDEWNKNTDNEKIQLINNSKN